MLVLAKPACSSDSVRRIFKILTSRPLVSFYFTYVGIGIDFKIKTINLDDKSVKVQIWDTAGQERFRTITQTYYRGANGVILAYDCTREESFENISNWVKQVEKHAAPGVEKILIGNKSDMLD